MLVDTYEKLRTCNFAYSQILSVAVYNHYKRIYYESLHKVNSRASDEGYVYSTSQGRKRPFFSLNFDLVITKRMISWSFFGDGIESGILQLLSVQV